VSGLSVAWLRRLQLDGRIAGEIVEGRRVTQRCELARYLTERRANAALAETDAWDWEGNLVKTLASHFRTKGWAVKPPPDATLHEHGVDLDLCREGQRLAVEVKGWPSEIHLRGPRQGLRKRWRPTAARSYMGDLLLEVLLLAVDPEFDDVALAVPNRETFTRLIVRLREPLKRLGIGIYVVSEDGQVEEWLEPKRRATK
jgi:hypothetical protein